MVNNNTQLIGLIGHPVSHSKSPTMHNILFRNLKLNYAYYAFDVKREQLEDAINGIKALSFRGLNVTIPHKVNVMQYLDEISPEAEAIGAVNTIVNEEGKLIGYNTDGEGYVRSLLEETKVDFKGKSIIILGTGGAAKAIAYTLVKYPIKDLILVSREVNKSNDFLQMLKNKVNSFHITYQELEAFLPNAHIIINTTPIGMYPEINQTLIKYEWIDESQIISDIIYNPLETKLIKNAKIKGATTHTGLGMFVYQGMLAFELWTGIVPDPAIMKKAVLETLSGI